MWIITPLSFPITFNSVLLHHYTFSLIYKPTVQWLTLGSVFLILNGTNMQHWFKIQWTHKHGIDLISRSQFQKYRFFPNGCFLGIFLDLSWRQWAQFWNNSLRVHLLKGRGRNSPILMSGSRSVRWPGKFFFFSPSTYAFVFTGLIRYSVRLVPV